MTQTVEQISSSIDRELACLAPIPSERCIFRVYDELRVENEKDYEPKVIAIGPYHHGTKYKLQEMEEHKMRYLELLLHRRNETSVDRYVMALSDWEEDARKCYAESFSFNKAKFVKMMLLDGVFVIELFRKWNARNNTNDPILQSERFRDSMRTDPILQFVRLRGSIRTDLLLLENQLPFFILVRLLNMTRDPNTQEDITYLALSFLDYALPGPVVSHVSDIPVNEVKHLLHLAHRGMCNSFVMSHGEMNNNENNKLELIHTISELQEGGIEFKVDEESNSLIDIKFTNGLMEIPRFTFYNETKFVLRNLIAFEQFLPDDIHPRYVTDYAMFMDCLVNSPKDAALLRCSRIIDNRLGDDTEVCDMLNKLTKNVWLSRNFCYTQVFKKVNKHCKRLCNKWKASLRHNYFNTPWAFISVMGAIVLLLLTITQTIFSVLSYF